MRRKWMGFLINCLKYGLLGCLGLLIAINMYLGISKGITHNPLPKFMGMAPLVVMSGSMEPEIMPGDLVIIREQAPHQYQLGDVATYMVGNTSYTHRIVAEEDGTFIFQGDNNNTIDEPVPAEGLVGKVLLKIPKLGLATLFFKTPRGIMALVALIVLLLYGEELIARLGARARSHGRIPFMNNKWS
jgi:signal peptidase